ncbi:hypothetical protein D3C72_1794010 [compost metagenome]
MVGEVGFHSQMPRISTQKLTPRQGAPVRGAGAGAESAGEGETSVERDETKESACIAAYQAEAQQGADWQAGPLMGHGGGSLCLSVDWADDNWIA